MKNLKMRQNFLLADWGFQCSCRLCQYEKSNHPDEEKYENFAKLQQQSKKLLEVAKTAGQVRLAIIKKEVTCYKEMYKLAEEKNASKVKDKWRKFFFREIELFQYFTRFFLLCILYFSWCWG